LPSPAVYPADTEDGLVEIGDRVGFVMERIDGPTMLEDLIAKPWRLRQHARSFARLHLEMHGTPVPDLPSQQERFERILDRLAEDLGSTMVQRIRESIPEVGESTACHGDYHPDNILLSQDGPVVIDWGPATKGSPAADIAWTRFLFNHGGGPMNASIRTRAAVAMLRAAFERTYRRSYRRASQATWDEATRWGPAIAAIRLGDGIPEERERILRILHEHFAT
jgi:aminoglycoside phosphotransferase (APT) family kinase protein